MQADETIEGMPPFRKGCLDGVHVDESIVVGVEDGMNGALAFASSRDRRIAILGSHHLPRLGHSFNFLGSLVFSPRVLASYLTTTTSSGFGDLFKMLLVRSHVQGRLKFMIRTFKILRRRRGTLSDTGMCALSIEFFTCEYALRNNNAKLIEVLHHG